MKKVKYPRYNRQQNLKCKLSDIDIKNIKRLRKQKMSLKDIANTYNVVCSTILYWTLSTIERSNFNHSHWLKQVKNKNTRYTQTKKEENKRFLERKYRIMPIKFKKYKRSIYENSKLRLK